MCICSLQLYMVWTVFAYHTITIFDIHFCFIYTLLISLQCQCCECLTCWPSWPRFSRGQRSVLFSSRVGNAVRYTERNKLHHTGIEPHYLLALDAAGPATRFSPLGKSAGSENDDFRFSGTLLRVYSISFAQCGVETSIFFTCSDISTGQT